MFEMMGNQFFMVRNYKRAAEMLTKALAQQPGNKAIRRKLIVCLTQTARVDEAQQLFLALIEEDADYIIDTDPQADDCPCPELVNRMDRIWADNRESLDFNRIMGILYLYCSLEHSIEFFRRAEQLAPDDADIRRILAILSQRTGRPATSGGKGKTLQRH